MLDNSPPVSLLGLGQLAVLRPGACRLRMARYPPQALSTEWKYLQDELVEWDGEIIVSSAQGPSWDVYARELAQTPGAWEAFSRLPVKLTMPYGPLAPHRCPAVLPFVKLFARNQLRPALARHIVPAPLKEDEELIIESDQIINMHEQPR